MRGETAITLNYYLSMLMLSEKEAQEEESMDTKGESLYVRGEVTEDGHLLCPIETSIVLFVLNYCTNKKTHCCVVALTDATHTGMHTFST